MFPSGIAGAALLVLRVSVAASLLVDGTLRWALVTSPWVLLIFVIPALLLVIGFLTPYAATVTCLVQLGVVILTGGQHNFHLLLSIPNGLVVALIGPGAYSIDAHIFGRRLLTVPRRR
jgi:uncharacterized membrane protein YphA (DoxX/SURF4 family)